MKFLRNLRRRRILQHYSLPDLAWIEILDRVPLLRKLPKEDRERLRSLITLFLHEKRFVPAADLDLTQAVKLHIAALACLPILNLDLDWYDDWATILVYPAEFVSPREAFDDIGVLHQWQEILGGEAWERGPVILSWADVEASGHGSGYNVVIHEMAHKLDMRNGPCDGFPPLHRGMDRREWTRAFTHAFQEFNARAERHGDPMIDPYAGESPGEFFAVLSEYFFEQPDLLHTAFPSLYPLLRAFYRLDPASWQDPHARPSDGLSDTAAAHRGPPIDSH
ncbi:MAG TPA: M90 family metallopeptidase [Methylococcus sp.]|nr:M90 family metallopeptidase [Methylococcus sp.]